MFIVQTAFNPPLVIIINRGSRVVKSNRTLPFTLLIEDAACASIALPFCLRLASLLMSGKTTINGATPVCWRKSSALCAISSASGTVPVTSVKSVFIIGIKGLLVAVRGRSISKLSNIMIFSWAGLPFPACLFRGGHTD